MREPDHDEDYIWHFRLRLGDLSGGGDDALTEMVRGQVAALLRCITLTSDGRDVTVTGFRFLADPGRNHPIPSLLSDRGSCDEDSDSNQEMPVDAPLP
jgi:hypothetical protein